MLYKMFVWRHTLYLISYIWNVRSENFVFSYKRLSKNCDWEALSKRLEMNKAINVASLIEILPPSQQGNKDSLKTQT